MDRKRLNKLAKERDRLIEDLNLKLDKTFTAAQNLFMRLFFDSFVDKLQRDENGIVLNNAFNRNLMLSVDALFTTFYKQASPVIVAAISGGVSKIIDFNNKYYSPLTDSAKLLPIKDKVMKNVKEWLGVEGDDKTAKRNGYIDTIIQNSDLKTKIKNMSMKAVYGQQGWFELRNEFKDWLEPLPIPNGTGTQMGKLKQYYRNYTYDLYSQIDRGTALTYATDLKFEFAVYEGGLIKTSRKFCKEHNGKVYHKTEIEEFKLEEAIPPNYNPFVDLGGYGCRHHLNWIPNSLAFVMRSDAEEYLKSLKAA